MRRVQIVCRRKTSAIKGSTTCGGTAAGTSSTGLCHAARGGVAPRGQRARLRFCTELRQQQVKGIDLRSPWRCCCWYPLPMAVAATARKHAMTPLAGVISIHYRGAGRDEMWPFQSQTRVKLKMRPSPLCPSTASCFASASLISPASWFVSFIIKLDAFPDSPLF